MNEKELQGTASQQSPNSCTRSSSFNEFKNPMIRLISCRASFATSKPCLGPCMEICTAGESSISRLISTSDSVQPCSQPGSQSQDALLHRQILGTAGKILTIYGAAFNMNQFQQNRSIHMQVWGELHYEWKIKLLITLINSIWLPPEKQLKLILGHLGAYRRMVKLWSSWTV